MDRLPTQPHNRRAQHGRDRELTRRAPPRPRRETKPSEMDSLRNPNHKDFANSINPENLEAKAQVIRNATLNPRARAPTRNPAAIPPTGRGRGRVGGPNSPPPSRLKTAHVL